MAKITNYLSPEFRLFRANKCTAVRRKWCFSRGFGCSPTYTLANPHPTPSEDSVLVRCVLGRVSKCLSLPCPRNVDVTRPATQRHVPENLHFQQSRSHNPAARTPLSVLPSRLCVLSRFTFPCHTVHQSHQYTHCTSVTPVHTLYISHTSKHTLYISHTSTHTVHQSHQ